MVELGSVTKAVTGLLLADAVVRGEVDARHDARRLPAGRPGGDHARAARHPHRRAPARAARAPAPRRLPRHDRPVRAHDRLRARATTSHACASAARAARATATSAPRCSARRSPPVPALPTSGWRRSACSTRSGSPRSGREGGPEPAQPHGRGGRPVAAVDARRLRARGLPARHRPRRARPRGRLPGAAAGAGRRGGARAHAPGAAATASARGWAGSRRGACGGTTAARTGAAPSSRCGRQSGRAVAAVANSRKAPDRAAVAQLNS